jgi:UDP-glucose 4-epimerase
LSRALVTGGAGFIGSHLVERLLAGGRRVRVLDDLSTGALANLAAARGPQLEVVTGSVMQPEVVDAALDGVDFVFHLAATVGVQLVARDPARAIHTQIRGTEHVLAAAARTGAGVLLASSSEVYGKGVKLPFSEDDDLVLGPPTSTRWSYACSKASAEYLTLAERRIPVVVARLFNTVGLRQVGDYGMVVPRFVAQAQAGEPLTVFGSGEQRRCFADVREVVGCLVRLAETPAAHGGIYNVGSDDEISIGALAVRVREQSGGRSSLVHVPYEAAYGPGFEDLGRRVPDLRRLEATIGERPRLGIDAILGELLEERSRE